MFRATGHALPQRVIAAAELLRVEGRDVGHVERLLRRRRAARVAPRLGAARTEAFDPRLRVAAEEEAGLVVPFAPRVLSENMQPERVRLNILVACLIRMYRTLTIITI